MTPGKERERATLNVTHYQLLVIGVSAGIIFLIWVISKLYLEG